MLRFQTPPDKPFMVIVSKSIEAMIEQIDEFVFQVNSEQEERENFQWLLPNASKVFNMETAFNILRKMLNYIFEFVHSRKIREIQ